MVRILVIDDDEQSRVFLRRVCEAEGYTVRLESTGARGVSQARSFKPDLILLDLVMPGMDGPDVAARLRDDPALRRIPVVFITSVVDTSEARALADILEYPILSKPFAVADVQRCLDQVLVGF